MDCYFGILSAAKYSKSLIRNLFFIIFFLTLAFDFPVESFAEPARVKGSFSPLLGPIVASDTRKRVYVLDPAAKQVIFINTMTEEVVRRKNINHFTFNMAISPDSNYLLVGGPKGDDWYLTRINLATLNKVTYKVPAVRFLDRTTSRIKSISFGSGPGKFVLVRSLGWYDIALQTVKANGGELTIESTRTLDGKLDLQGHSPLLRRSADGNLIYLSTGRPPAQIHMFHVGNFSNPTYIGSSIKEDLGTSWTADFAVSPKLNELYVPARRLDGVGVLSADYLEPKGIIGTGQSSPAFNGIDIDPSGKVLVIVDDQFSDEGKLYQFNAKTRKLVKTFSLPSNLRYGEASDTGVAVSKSGGKAFVVHGDSFSAKNMAVWVIKLK